MPTHNPRVNVTFEPDIMATLDRVLSALAKVRDHDTVKTVKHDDAWK